MTVLQYYKFYTVRSIREYRSNASDTYQKGIQSYRRLRRLLRYSQLDVHVDQIDIHAIGKHNKAK